jgi:hypothetical protein
MPNKVCNGYQGCQMVYLHTCKSTNFIIIWRVLEWKMLVYLTAIGIIWQRFGIFWPFGIFRPFSIWWPFGTVFSHLVYFSCLGLLYQKNLATPVLTNSKQSVSLVLGLPDGIFAYLHMQFLVIWYISPVLVCCTKKNLATLAGGCRPF